MHPRVKPIVSEKFFLPFEDALRIFWQMFSIVKKVVSFMDYHTMNEEMFSALSVTPSQLQRHSDIPQDFLQE